MPKGINTEEVQRRIAADAHRTHEWPKEIGLGPDISAINVYRAAQQQRSYAKWTPIDLIELARISKLIVLADHEFETYLREGVVIGGGRNGTTPVENPRGRAISTLNSTINAGMRRLGLTTMSTNTDKKTSAFEAEAEREVRASIAAADEDDRGGVPDTDLLN
jgi:hypothetical protein